MDLHRAACRRMVVSSKWAIKKWEEDLGRKLRGPGVGNKTWWSLVKEKQRISRQDSIPPLTKQDGTAAVSSKEKARLLANLFSAKMKDSHRVSALRRVASFLDRGGKLLLYKAQIRPYLEYAALSWMSCAASHTRRLDSIQRRALRLVDAADPPAQPEPVSPLDSLEHRRDAAALVVFHKAQVQGVPHLAGLQQPPRIATRSTRTMLTSGDAVEVPRSRCQPAPTHLCGPRLQEVEHFHGRRPSHPGDEHTKCKVGGQSVETVEAHPADSKLVVVMMVVMLVVMLVVVVVMVVVMVVMVVVVMLVE
ncbi:hypothetical protein GWK47_015309 [Chionoecetes opilio]|uniref:RNA-directed DNA polymerase from mobile element jockey n=1 Tax=Chionoecetes opilio TaxID=41210 RepID=A0A8J4XTG2_CHIOP|nr:hypothetical protein GWK47_015309 [Chionoecetes opilio]